MANGENPLTSLVITNAEGTTAGTAGDGQLANLTIQDAAGTTVATSPSGVLFRVPGFAPIWMILTGPADILQPLIDHQLYTIACENNGQPASYQGYSQGTGSPQGLSFILR